MIEYFVSDCGLVERDDHHHRFRYGATMLLLKHRHVWSIQFILMQLFRFNDIKEFESYTWFNYSYLTVTHSKQVNDLIGYIAQPDFPGTTMLPFDEEDGFYIKDML